MDNQNKPCERCKLPPGEADFKVRVGDEDFVMDPCLYQTTDYYTNCTVEISKCVRCGHISITWHASPETERIDPDEIDGIPL